MNQEMTYSRYAKNYTRISLEKNINVGTNKPENIVFFEKFLCDDMYEIADFVGVREYLYNTIIDPDISPNDLIKPLWKKLQTMKKHPPKYEKFKEKYNRMIGWLYQFIEALKKYPKVKICIKRYTMCTKPDGSKYYTMLPQF